MKSAPSAFSPLEKTPESLKGIWLLVAPTFEKPLHRTTDMDIESIVTGAFKESCYIVWNTEQQALVFDPGFDAPQISAVLKKHELEVAAYICTHAHADHINALAEMHQQFPAPIAMHTLDLEWAFEPVNQIMPYYPTPARPKVDSFLRLEQSDEWTFADLHFQCIEKVLDFFALLSQYRFHIFPFDYKVHCLFFSKGMEI